MTAILLLLVVVCVVLLVWIVVMIHRAIRDRKALENQRIAFELESRMAAEASSTVMDNLVALKHKHVELSGHLQDRFQEMSEKFHELFVKSEARHEKELVELAQIRALLEELKQKEQCNGGKK